MLKEEAYLNCSFKYPLTSGQIPLLAIRCKINNWKGLLKSLYFGGESVYASTQTTKT